MGDQRLVLPNWIKTGWLLFILLWSPFTGQAAFEIQTVDPAAIACGHIVSLHPGLLNPAVNLEQKVWQLKASYTNLFGLKALQCWNLALYGGYGPKQGGGLLLSSLGNPDYQENSLSCSHAFQVHPHIFIGLSLTGYSLSIVGYSRTWSWGLNTGAKLYLHESLNVAILYQNINNAKVYQGDEALPQTFSMGLQWYAYPRLECDLEIFKDTLYPFATRAALKMELIPNIVAMTGVQLNPDRFAAGLQCRWKRMGFSAALFHHQALPITFYFGCHVSCK